MKAARKDGPVIQTARRTTARRIPKEVEATMTVILRGVPPRYHWGWFAREDQRMHVQTMDDQHRHLHKVWLERSGRRVFEPDGDIPAKVLKRVEAEVQTKRAHVEGRWVDLMIENRWLQLRVAGSKVVLTAYPDTPNRFTRTLDLRDYFRPETVALIKPEDVVLTSAMGAVEVFPKRPEERRHHIRLSTILWQD